ncbi:hypothetical protein DY000_02018244 [Brassica cretica]|uniref:Uncharacterized protein n=1 Tax=Brassica cretica TaxID=69181 RepID=A0ABQ7D5W7_BRACR|nr:hypothetical protein DY000_02018244 [Brassica cretica]
MISTHGRLRRDSRGHLVVFDVDNDGGIMSCRPSWLVTTVSQTSCGCLGVCAHAVLPWALAGFPPRFLGREDLFGACDVILDISLALFLGYPEEKLSYWQNPVIFTCSGFYDSIV